MRAAALVLFFLFMASPAIIAGDVSFSEKEQRVSDLLRSQVKLDPSNADAYFYLALELINEQSDSDEIFRLMERAAELGNAQACAYIALFYQRGAGVKKDDAQSAVWMQRAADAGVVSAISDLGVMYYYGRGVKQDVEKAGALWKSVIALDENYSDAYYNLAVLLLEHNPTEEQIAESESLLHKAAQLGDVEAMLLLAEEYSSEGGLYPLKQEKAFQFWHSAANRNDAQAYIPLAECYLHGRGTEQDIQLGLEYMQLAASAGVVAAMRFLAVDYGCGGRFVEPDAREAVKWGVAALDNLPDDASLHSLVADNVLKISKDTSSRQRAYEHYAQAAARNDARALYMLGRAWEGGWAYEQGVCQPVAQDKAAQYYAQALESGNPVGGAALVRMVDLGYTGVEMSTELWLRLLKQAAEAGVKGCAAKLAAYYSPLGGETPDAAISAQWMEIAIQRDATPWAMAMKAWLEMSQDYESSEKLREAARLFHDAADRGNAWALVGLGTLYLARNGPFPYNAGKAIELFRQAARMGEAEGAEMIAEMCASGEGVQKNWWLSRKWRRYARSIKFQQRNKKESLIELED